MATDSNRKAWSVQATEDLSVATAKFHAVSLAGLVVASTSRAAGILVTSTKSGEQASVIYEGATKAMVGGTVTTVGYPLTVTTSGWLIAASSGGAMVGRATVAAASGDLVPVWVDFMTIPAWPGV
jgi:hypothetical protein